MADHDKKLPNATNGYDDQEIDVDTMVLRLFFTLSKWSSFKLFIANRYVLIWHFFCFKRRLIYFWQTRSFLSPSSLLIHLDHYKIYLFLDIELDIKLDT